MRRPVHTELPALSATRNPARRLLASSDDRPSGMDVSLHLKILTGYLVTGGTLLVAFQLLDTQPLWIKASSAAVITLVLATALPYLLARLTRVRILSRSALEISRGDLSKPVVLEPGFGRDEIDELSTAISNMQENLRELVGHIQRTAQSVSDSANDLQRSAEGVNASTGEVGSSMKKIASGADSQSQLVGRASAVITEIANSIQKTAVSAEDAARAAAETSGAAEEGSNAARLAGEKVKKVFSGIESASQ
ncbi:MAG TPA: methyl-accepting chemotaxis protein, partial [Myxococcaceae bacterium]|nr:methyl-accepting chemotaxis protein [Myxococcaceae bacterium]